MRLVHHVLRWLRGLRRLTAFWRWKAKDVGKPLIQAQGGLAVHAQAGRDNDLRRVGRNLAEREVHCPQGHVDDVFIHATCNNVVHENSLDVVWVNNLYRSPRVQFFFGCQILPPKR